VSEPIRDPITPVAEIELRQSYLGPPAGPQPVHDEYLVHRFGGRRSGARPGWQGGSVSND